MNSDSYYQQGPELLGDYSVLGNKRKSRLVSRKKEYRDLDLKLTLHPVRKDIMPLRDNLAVKNSVKNLILTNFFERPFQNELGANLRGLLFEPADAITRGVLKDNINDVLEIEKRIRVNRLDIIDLPNENAYQITVNFVIINTNNVENVQVVLKRLR